MMLMFMKCSANVEAKHLGCYTVYPSLGQFGPYVQQLMILILKSTQNLGVITECKGRRFCKGLARC